MQPAAELKRWTDQPSIFGKVRMDLIECIREAWGWIGIDPAGVVDCNEFGNVLVRDSQRRVWWIQPELLSCTVVAQDAEGYHRLRADSEFVLAWEMKRLVWLARKMGALEAGRSYCFKVPPALGAPYEVENMATLSTVELVGVSGDIAMQIRDLPDGAPIEIKIVD